MKAVCTTFGVAAVAAAAAPTGPCPLLEPSESPFVCVASDLSGAVVVIEGGGIDTEGGEISIGSEAGAVGGEDLVEVGAEADAEGCIGIDFGRDAGDRRSVGNALRGRDSVVAMLNNALNAINAINGETNQCCCCW
jgi:hypothetical protein